MFVDASAIVAILGEEPDGPDLAARLEEAERRWTSPVALYEGVLALARLRRAPVERAQAEVENFVAEARIEVMPITAEIGWAAIRAFERFGRGRHRASLNMGDCFAYACAMALDVPLLFKGDDFPRTDITVA